MWAIVKTKYDFPEDNKPYVIADLGKKWREWKSTLRSKYFLQNEPPSPGSVIPSEYQILCDFWNSPEGQKLCATNKANRAEQTIAHTAGSRSYARVTKMEFKAKKKMPIRAETFVITHTKKDGEAADPKSKEIMILTHLQGVNSNYTPKDVFQSRAMHLPLLAVMDYDHPPQTRLFY
ncbi:uncharacterized protein LOC143875675 [Tasmannia lanceolata]|uniref:uncharacterized protein LOC143875675 n=1 Tax=Tasmannia lanceolata TaxID=3420 RepID=UPI004062F69C